MDFVAVITTAAEGIASAELGVTEGIKLVKAIGVFLENSEIRAASTTKSALAGVGRTSQMHWRVAILVAMSSTSSGQTRNVYANDANVELINAVANNEQARVFFGFPRSAAEAARHNLVFRGMQRAGDFAASALRYIGWGVTPGPGPPEQRAASPLCLLHW